MAERWPPAERQRLQEAALLRPRRRARRGRRHGRAMASWQASEAAGGSASAGRIAGGAGQVHGIQKS